MPRSGDGSGYHHEPEDGEGDGWRLLVNGRLAASSEGPGTLDFVWTTYSAGRPINGALAERILGATTLLFEQRGQRDIVALLIDVAALSVAETDVEIPGYEDDTNWYHNADAERIVLLEVDADQLPRFTPDLIGRIEPTLLDVLRRVVQQDEPEDFRFIAGTVRHVGARERLPDVASDWRDRLGRDLLTDEVTNQARRERLMTDRPKRHGMTFASKEEVLVYDALVGLQERSEEDRTIAVLPLPSARLRSKNVWTPDLVVLGNGRALIIEVDGPHHRAGRRVADDHNRDLQWRRCGVTVVRLPVEDLLPTTRLERRLAEEIKRVLFGA